MIGAPSDGFPLTPFGQARLGGLGLDIGAIERGRRALTRPCLDWTERRPHLAGSLAAALAARLLELDWIRRRTDTRALTITDTGRGHLRAELGINL